MTHTDDYIRQRLRGLGPAWRALHPAGLGESGSDIDHLVIGPGGVFTLHAEHRDPRDARRAARVVADALSEAAGQKVVVVPLQVLARGEPEPGQPGGVLTCRARDLALLLKNLRPSLRLVEIGAIHAAARRPATWLERTVVAHEITPSWNPQARIFPQPTRSRV
jgi:hypothetical protein